MTELNENALILQTTFQVTSADTDMFGRLRLGAFVNYLIQSAIQSADALGFGFQNLTNQNLFWVLSRIDLQIIKPLKWYDKVTVETWPKNIVKLFYIRDYKVFDQNGELVAVATSAWLSIDKESKRPKQVSSDYIDNYRKLKEKHAIRELPSRLDPVPDGELFQYKASFFDIDLNQHVTATRYVDWMMDTFEVGFHKAHYPTGFSINFIKETFLEEELLIRKTDQQGAFSMEGETTSGETKVRGAITF